MPPARSSAAHARPGTRSGARQAPSGAPRGQGAARAGQGFQPRRVKSRAPLSRIRWDRASRVVMLGALVLVAYLWISGLSSLMRTHAQAERGLEQVRQLAAENHHLRAEARALTQKATIIEQARKLGMVRSGEQAFVVTH